MKEKIKMLMNLYNLNQAAFSQKIGITPATTSKILSGRRKPSLAILIKISEAFNVPVDWLIKNN